MKETVLSPSLSYLAGPLKHEPTSLETVLWMCSYFSKWDIFLPKVLYLAVQFMNKHHWHQKNPWAAQNLRFLHRSAELNLHFNKMTKRWQMYHHAFSSSEHPSLHIKNTSSPSRVQDEVVQAALGPSSEPQAPIYHHEGAVQVPGNSMCLSHGCNSRRSPYVRGLVLIIFVSVPGAQDYSLQ